MTTSTIPLEFALSLLSSLNLASNKATKELRAAVEPGEYVGSALLRVNYRVKVGADHEAEVNARAPWRELALALLARVNEATREKVVRDLLDADAVTPDAAGQGAAEALVKRVLGTTRGVVSGKVTGSCDVLEVPEVVDGARIVSRSVVGELGEGVEL